MQDTKHHWMKVSDTTGYHILRQRDRDNVCYLPCDPPYVSDVVAAHNADVDALLATVKELREALDGMVTARQTAVSDEWRLMAYRHATLALTNSKQYAE